MSVIGVIGDIHCNHELLEIAINSLTASCDQVFCVGDIVDGIGDPEQCIALLSRFQIPTLLGNHDEWCIQGKNLRLPNPTDFLTLSKNSQDFLGQLPRSIRVSNGILICHGLGDNNMGRISPDDFGYALAVNDDFQNLSRDRELNLLVKGHEHSAWFSKFGALQIVCTGALQEKTGGFVCIHEEAGLIQIFSIHNKRIVTLGEYHYH